MCISCVCLSACSVLQHFTVLISIVCQFNTTQNDPKRSKWPSRAPFWLVKETENVTKACVQTKWRTFVNILGGKCNILRYFLFEMQLDNVSSSKCEFYFHNLLSVDVYYVLSRCHGDSYSACYPWMAHTLFSSFAPVLSASLPVFCWLNLTINKCIFFSLFLFWLCSIALIWAVWRVITLSNHLWCVTFTETCHEQWCGFVFSTILCLCVCVCVCVWVVANMQETWSK